MKIDYVFISCNDNEKYLEFWPIVADAWQKIVGITPILIFVPKTLDKYPKIDGSTLEVPYIENNNLQAQLARLFAASYMIGFQDSNILISDLDMMPLSKEYFVDQIENIPDNHLIVYSSDAYLKGNPSYPSYPMCYLAAKGSTFREIINVTSKNIEEKYKEWENWGYGWFTDEKGFYREWARWFFNDKSRTSLLRRGFNRSEDPMIMRRICRSYNSSCNLDLLRRKYYIDFHMPRPYNENKELIDKIFNEINLVYNG